VRQLRLAEGRAQEQVRPEQEQKRQEHAQRELTSQLEARLEALTLENNQLRAHVAHGEKVRALLGAVTSRTNEVQEAADSVLKQVEATKRVRTQPVAAEQGAKVSAVPSAQGRNAVATVAKQAPPGGGTAQRTSGGELPIKPMPPSEPHTGGRGGRNGRGEWRGGVERVVLKH